MTGKVVWNECPCGNPKDVRAKKCRQCYDGGRTIAGRTTVCACGNAKDKRSKNCIMCKTKRSKTKTSEELRLNQRSRSARYRARVRSALIDVLPSDYYQRVMDFYRVCGICGASDALQLDHVIPLNKNGQHAIINFGVLCKSHNVSKQDRMCDDYRPYPRLVDCIG